MALLQDCVPYAAESLPGICCRRHCILLVLPPRPCPDRHLKLRPFCNMKVSQHILPPLILSLVLALSSKALQSFFNSNAALLGSIAEVVVVRRTAWQEQVIQAGMLR